METVDARVALLDGRIGEQAVRIDDNREALVSLEARIDRRFDQFELRMDRRFDGVDRRFGILEQRLNGLDQKFTWVAGTMVAGFVTLAGLILRH